VRLIRVSRSEAMKLAGHILRVYEIKTAYRTVVENMKRSDHSEKPRRRREDNIKMVLENYIAL
jgi:hypothetical protein